VAGGVQQHGFHESSLGGLNVRRYLNRPGATGLLVRAVRQPAVNGERRPSCCNRHRSRWPRGRAACLLARIWADKITRDHPELADHLDAVVQAVAGPDHVEPDALPARRRFYRRNVGPSRWLMAVVSYEQQPARIITALANRKDPKRWKP
jgi:hypothetical protein